MLVWILLSAPAATQLSVWPLAMGTTFSYGIWLLAQWTRDAWLSPTAKRICAWVLSPMIALLWLAASVLYSHFGELFGYGLLRYTSTSGSTSGTASGFLTSYVSWWHVVIWVVCSSLLVRSWGWGPSPQFAHRGRYAAGVAAVLVAIVTALYSSGLGPRSGLESSVVTALVGHVIAPTQQSLPTQHPVALSQVEPPQGDLPDVVLILNESMGRQHLLPYEGTRDTMPALNAWVAKQGDRAQWFEWAYAPSTTTRLSVPALLTGLGPESDRETLAKAPMLWNWAKRAGYTTALVSAQCYTWGEFDDFFRRQGPDIYEGCHNIDAEITNDAGIDELAVSARFGAIVDRAPRDKPLLLVYNTNALHDPYQTRSPTVPGLTDTSRPPYEQALQIVDRALLDLRQALARRQREDHTITMMTSDHGARPQRAHRPPRVNSFYDEFTRVPLLISVPKSWAPQQQKLAKQAPTRHVTTPDLTPTLLHWMGLDPSTCTACPEMTGVGLQDEVSEDRTLVVINNTPMRVWHHEGFGLIRGPWRMVYSTLESPGLYDVRQDPQQQQNLWGERPEVQRSLERFIEQRPLLRKMHRP